MNLLKFYIDGKWVDPVKPDVIDVINPASEKSIGNVSVGSKADIDKAVKAARNAFQKFSKTLVSERVELLTEIIKKDLMILLLLFKLKWVLQLI